MNLDTYQLNLKGNLNVSDLLMNPKFKSHFELAQFSPKELMKVLNIDIPKMLAVGEHDLTVYAVNERLNTVGSARTVQIRK